MTTINVHINSLYACHIAYLSYLFKIPNVNIISSNSNKIFNFNTSDYKVYYERMITKQFEDTNFFLQDVGLFEWFIKNQFTFYTSEPSPGLTITITNNTSLLDAQTDFFTQLDTNNVINDLNLYESNIQFDGYKRVIRWAIQTVLGRPATPIEEDYYYYHNGLGLYNPIYDSKFINLFTFIHILYFGLGREQNLHLPWITVFKANKFSMNLTVPRVAVLLSGHSRNYVDFLTSYKSVIENPFIDIFIHTWTHKGPRYEYINETISSSTLLSDFNAMSILVEDEEPKKNIFSLRGRINPIFLVWGQQGDDATRYVNSHLYSLWKAMTLMEQYEQTNNVLYDGIIKLNFNLELTNFDYSKIINDIAANVLGIFKNALYVPPSHPEPFKYPKTGGCILCEKEAAYALFNYSPNHLYHLNDLCTTWFYGRRNIAKKACELYLTAETILNSYQTSNLANYLNVPHKVYREFVYIQFPDHYQGKVYNVYDGITSQNRVITCFYPERLMREHMKLNTCVSSKNIDGNLRHFDIITSKV